MTSQNKSDQVCCGIDYSMSGPSACFHPLSKPFSFDNCKIYFLTDSKKYNTKSYCGGIVTGLPFPEYSSNEQRYDAISGVFLNILDSVNCQHVALEDYAFAATGRVFGIGENTGLLKHKLWKSNKYSVNLFAPAHIKKLSTGKGNSNKDAMYEAFIMETGVDLVKEMVYNKQKIGSPIADIVDSFYICKVMYNILTKS
jgi:Holliday junction resolvasome RuvABC endonuclease subunit